MFLGRFFVISSPIEMFFCLILQQARGFGLRNDSNGKILTYSSPLFFISFTEQLFPPYSSQFYLLQFFWHFALHFGRAYSVLKIYHSYFAFCILECFSLHLKRGSYLLKCCYLKLRGTQLEISFLLRTDNLFQLITEDLCLQLIKKRSQFERQW